MKKRTNNSFLQDKINIRISNLPKRKNFAVLNCFAGKDVIWKRIEKRLGRQIERLNIDQIQQHYSHIKADNMEIMAKIDLSAYDIIDLDSYGCPIKQLELIFKKQYKGIVFATIIQKFPCRLPMIMLKEYGYTKSMLDTKPSLLIKKGIEIIECYLYSRGVRRMKYLEIGMKRCVYINLEL